MDGTMSSVFRKTTPVQDKQAIRNFVGIGY